MNFTLRQYFIFILIFVNAQLGFTQSQSIDSLKAIASKGVKDTVTVNALNALSNSVLITEGIPNSLIYAQKAFDLAKGLNYKKGEAYALKNIGLGNYYQSNYLKVLDFWTESLRVFESIKDTTGIANLSNNLGAVYYSQGFNAKALGYYLRALSIAEKKEDYPNIAQTVLNIGGVYAEMNNFEKALEYYKKFVEFKSRVNNPKLELGYLLGVGEVYFKQAQFDQALNYYQAALNINTIKTARPGNLIKLSKVFLKKGEKQKAIKYLNEAYELARFNDQKLLEVQALEGLGEIYKNSNFSASINAFKEAEELAKEIEANDELVNIYNGMSSAYALQKDFKNAFSYKQLYTSKKDSLFNSKTVDKIRGLQFDYDLEKKENKIQLLEKESQIQSLTEKKQQYIIYASGFAIFLIIILAIGLYRRYYYVRKTNYIIEEQKNISDSLLHNILPEETATELKQNGKVQAKKFDSVTVMFTDFIGFTKYSAQLTPEELVNSVGYYFSEFDQIMQKYGLEKIKTIGDAYMCAGGLPFPNNDHPFKMILAAFEITKFIEDSFQNKELTGFDIRIGINTGPIVAGVVGIHKFAYDIWGDTVNVASRMETQSAARQINISENTYQLVKDVFYCKYRGEIEVKNRGMMKMYFVEGIKDQTFLDQLEYVNKL
ncbi:adenylate/guanylate cyclase domain-containing protein [Gaetbulibacter sp. M240]|uniref:adenylate/guanylate cyclase domain-containing protein n=1 Tax=Gaetbulibacter sp. M240 TaxID=3126511 RepID=UPI00374ECB32